ncbi:uncharacterized protein LOC114531616 [Dendronephthya gigantea]|uniref:uncharacterized protein LOC114531616 n=1 Tax=Dendronephthya gigantea TaxID=151771 RepID=UPI00106C7276|nr:uncharacterized protein LOC114531616 [Dendronephthya gigantea]
MAVSEEFFQKLHEVLLLIFSKIDKIVDDTSLEKLLEILHSLYSHFDERKRIENVLVKYFNRIQHAEKITPATLSFTLRLSVVITCSSEGFHVFFSLDNILQYLLREVIRKHEFWTDPCVRDSYFKAAIGIISTNNGFIWLQKSGVLQHAMNNLVDSSIFVADSARTFIAKYIITLHKSTTNHNDTHNESGDEDSPMHHCPTPARNTLLKHCATCVKCIVNHFKNIIEETPTGLIRTMPYQVSIVQLLLTLMEENTVTAQEILHPSAIMVSCFELFNHANKEECGKLTDVIFTMLTNTSSWQLDWPLLLHLKEDKHLLNIFLEFILVLCKRHFVFYAFQLVQGMFHARKFMKSKESGLCSLFVLLTFPVHGTFHKIEETNNVEECQSAQNAAKEMLLLDYTGGESYSTVPVFIKDIFKHVTSLIIAQSLTVTTDIIHDIELSAYSPMQELVHRWCKDIVHFLGQQSDNYFAKNTLTRFFIKALVICLERNLFNDDTTKEECHKLFIRLLSTSQDNMILGSCYEGLKWIYKPHQAFPTYVNVGALNNVLLQQCSIPCWDTRDSALNFLQYLLQTFDVSSLQVLLDQKLLLELWKLMEDGESYVRASSIYLLQAISARDAIWKQYCDSISLSEEKVLNYIVNAFQKEEESFPRRAVVDILRLWLETEHSIILMYLKDKFTSTTVAKVLNKACEDFDWEVKLCALNFWETMLNYYCEKINVSLSIDYSWFEEICLVVLSAITDYDQPVREKGMVILQRIKMEYVHQSPQDELNYHGSLDDLRNFTLQMKQQKNYSLLQTLLVLNLNELEDQFQTNSLTQDPVSFLEDILAAASENQHNLLDCY